MLKNSKVVSFLSPFKVGQAGNLWTLPRICPYARTNLYDNSYLSIFRKSVEKIQLWLKSDKNNGYFTWRSVLIYDNPLSSSRMKEKIKSRIFCSIFPPPPENRDLYEVMWKKYVGATYKYSTAHAHCTLDNKGCKHTLRIWHIFGFSTATLVTRTLLIVTFMRIFPVL